MEGVQEVHVCRDGLHGSFHGTSLVSSRDVTMTFTYTGDVRSKIGAMFGGGGMMPMGFGAPHPILTKKAEERKLARERARKV